MTSQDTTTDRLRRTLEAEILCGQLAPGDELDERRIAARFDVSRTPVRQALMQLDAAGLVAMRPRQTALVTALDARELAQMFEVLAALEALACELAARRISEDQLAELDQVNSDIAVVLEKGDVEAYIVLNMQFHGLIWAGAHNAHLSGELRALRLRLAPYRRWLIEKMHRMRRCHHEHLEIAVALRDGRSEEAASLMRRHVQDGDRFVDFLMVDRTPVRA